MSAKGQQHAPQTRLARLIVPTLEKVVKAASWRKHSKLITECKQVIEYFTRPADRPIEYSLPPSTVRPRAPTEKDKPVESTSKTPEVEHAEEKGEEAKEESPSDSNLQQQGEANEQLAEPSAAPSSNGAAETGELDSEASEAGPAGDNAQEPTTVNGANEPSPQQNGSHEPDPGQQPSSSAAEPAAVAKGQVGPQDRQVPLPSGKESDFAWGMPAQVILYDEGDVAISHGDAEMILHPLQAACETQVAKIIEPVLDCIQKLVAHGHLRGEVDIGTTPDTKLLMEVLDAVCRCYDVPDESVELLVLRALLTAVTSTVVRVHGECLLKIVRTCYNIFLGSKSVVNQTTAKATLTQMLILVFRRMEADSTTVAVTPIVVADLMEPAERSNADNTALQFVQNFVNKVVQDLGDALVTVPAKPMAGSSKHDGAFDTTVDNSHPADEESLRDRDMLDAKSWEINMYKDALQGQKKVSGILDKGGSINLDDDRELDAAAEQNNSNKLKRDAFLVFRALCKLSMKAPPQEGVIDPFAIRGKVVALELLKILLENAGPTFRSNERFVGAIKQYLCLSLLKNSASSLLSVFQLSCSIFMSLVSRFRAGLKAEIGVFFPMIVLRVLENVAQPNFQQKIIVLRFLEKLSVDPQILVDIFVNYDCDLDSSNIFERMVNGLLKTAQGVPPGAESTLTAQQDSAMRLAAIKCLVGVLRSMGSWTNRQFNVAAQSGPVPRSPRTGGERDDDTGSMSMEHVDSSDALSEPNSSELSEAAQFEQRRAYKLEFQEGIALFNRKPKKGIDFLVKAGKLGNAPEEVSAFLREATGLDKVMIGEYLGERDDNCIKVMHAYVDSFQFTAMEFDNAIRALLNGFRLPGEAQKIDRIMEKFAERYCKCNPKAFGSADTAYVLAYSVIMLNTDAHNPMVKSKMTKEQFIKNNRGIDESGDLPEEFLGALYDRIVRHEIKMKADPTVSAEAKAPAARAGGLDMILNLVGPRRRIGLMNETSEDVIRHTQELFRQKAGKSGSTYYAAADIEIVRPMVEVVWAPMLAAFSVPLDNSDDQIMTYQCLEGFRHAIHVTSMMCMETIRDAYITSLAKFTSLHSAADIRQKNIDAIKTLIQVAEEDGNYLQDAWEHSLTCISRFEHLHQIGEGVMTDTTLFGGQAEGDKGKPPPKSYSFTSKGRTKGRFPHSSLTASSVKRGSYESAGVGGSAAGANPEQIAAVVANLNLLEQIDTAEINRIFVRSERLNSEAIVEFVKALCKVSLDELRSPSEPRVFSLTKIVEIAHFNMTRIRLVWTRIWAVLAEYFVTVGCSENLSVAMYAVDSLRQLAMKFLERDELANYNFQNEFLKPFVVVMRRSSSVEIRELIIRCVSQMVFARVANVKSGWKVMFMVFTTAAADEHKNIVLLAFETIERIVREYFSYITETETTTFTDCVNCLIAFTNSRFNKDVSLNAIAFLRFCALKLAEGELGRPVPRKVKQLVEGEAPGPSGSPAQGSPRQSSPGRGATPGQFTDREDHLYFWFPLLAGLSELTFDPRPDIRKSALEVLFDTLRYHGHMFSPALWERVFDSVLFPIFDYVRRASVRRADSQLNAERRSLDEGDEDEEYERHHKSEELEMDAWLYETCTLALQLVVDLFVKFYTVVAPLLSRILALLTGFMKRPHESLAAIGVAAFVRLMSSAGELFEEEGWQEVLAALQETALATVPELMPIVELFEAGEAASSAGEAGEGRRPSSGGAVGADDALGGPVLGAVGAQLQQAIRDVRCRTAVQLLLVQAVSELYASQWRRLSGVHTLLLLDTLYSMAQHAHQVDSNTLVRQRLYKLRSTTQLPDPPLLRLESEAYHAYLNMLQRIPADKPELAKPGAAGELDVEQRLVQLCAEVLTMYVRTARLGSALAPDLGEASGENAGGVHWVVPLGSARRRELVARGPLVVACLKAMGGLKDVAFRKHLKGQFFGLLTQLVGCEHAAPDVQAALSALFAQRIGPLVMRAIQA